ncbi:craniofacial development protein 2-like [Clytia hemisphaerica]|uniref:Endonuclease/exonuclease/phosphatase domain-containing protein n=1 Tax=Clytia hemisphaerica TaxID=252671 RepID=A0A7M5V4V0_9CNID
MESSPVEKEKFTRRPKLDKNKGKKENFIQRKLKFIISTLNVQTLPSVLKKQELAHHAKTHGIDVICIQEHRIVHSEILLQEKINGYTLLTSSAWKNDINAATGGVGFLLSYRAVKSITSIKSHNQRVIELTQDGNPKTTILSCYSPHNNYPEDSIKSFYHDIFAILDTIPAHNFLLLGGDYNAQLGPEDARFIYSTETNRNDTYLKDFMLQYNLIATNTALCYRKNRLWTHKKRMAKKRNLTAS